MRSVCKVLELKAFANVSVSKGEQLSKLFEWCDGPLVLAMKTGAMLLVDEISLADDSVLERLNSVLEPERTLLLAEKGGSGLTSGEDVDVLVAHEDFKIIATMNPGGDFGKKEVWSNWVNRVLNLRFVKSWFVNACTQLEGTNQ